jgi:hypothetical protein
MILAVGMRARSLFIYSSLCVIGVEVGWSSKGAASFGRKREPVVFGHLLLCDDGGAFSPLEL